jgi:hypothetical protein
MSTAVNAVGTHYVCALCKGSFKTDRDDNEAIAEAEKLFPGVPMKDCVLVCNDCFKAMGLREPE